MWISRKKWAVMEDRVFALEQGEHRYCSLAHEKPEPKEPILLAELPEYPVYRLSDYAVPVSDVVRALLNHLGLRVLKEPARSSFVTLAPNQAAPKAPKK